MKRKKHSLDNVFKEIESRSFREKDNIIVKLKRNVERIVNEVGR